jgi:hypothetical protein
LALVVVLSLIVALHLYWGIGGRWPGKDAKSLASIVVGTSSRPMPGLIACALVAAALMAQVGLVAVSNGWMSLSLPMWALQAAFAGAIAVLGARGAATYVAPQVFKYAEGTPFHALNRWAYSPLCLLIAAGLVWEFPYGRGTFLGLDF